MKVLLVSSFRPGHLGLSYLRAFQKLGYEPICFDMEEEYEKASPLTQNRYTNKIILPYATRIMNKKLLNIANDCKPDLIFIHKGLLVYPETLKEIKANNAALLFIFNPDDPFNPSVSSKFIRNSIPIYDVYFIWTKNLISKLENAGAKHVEYLPFACEPELHYPISLTEEDRKIYGSDVVFVGNWDEEREKWLSELKDYNLAIWGTDYWGKRCKNKFLKSCWKDKAVVGNEMSKILQSSKICLNILRVQNKRSHNMRTFEIPASYGFMMHERSDEVMEFFEENKDAIYFSTPKDLKEKVNYYLPRDGLRKEITEKAFQKAQRYTYYERVKRIIEVYTEIRSKYSSL